jgi:hypothetical protein
VRTQILTGRRAPKCNADVVIESYSKRLNRVSWDEFKKCWSGYLIIRTLSGLAFAVVPQIHRGFHSRLSLAELLQGAGGGVLVSILATYLHSRRKGAEALDASFDQALEQANKTIESRDRALQDLQKKRRTPAEEHNYQLARRALEELGSDATAVLRHLRNHESLTATSPTIQFGPPSYDIQPAMQSMNTKTVVAMLDACAARDLVTRTPFTRSSGGVVPITGSTYQIASGMRSAIEELLYQDA